MYTWQIMNNFLRRITNIVFWQIKFSLYFQTTHGLYEKVSLKAMLVLIITVHNGYSYYQVK